MQQIQIGAISLGCSKNLVDTETMLGLLQEDGYTFTDHPESADILLINTCGFIESAKKESIDTILECTQYKKTGKLKLLIVSGCLAERYKEEVAKEIPEVDAVIGTGAIQDIVTIIQKSFSQRQITRVAPENSELGELPRILSTPSYMAYLKIAEGCDNHCTYCIIPRLRGQYRSRPMEILLKEANTLAKSGVKELVVIAQDTTHYGIDLYSENKLAELLSMLCQIDELKWIRLLYAYPEQLNDDVIDVMAKQEKIVKYLDLPVQHCHNTILKKMARRTTKEDLLALFSKLRAKIPSIALRTSLIVGFPSETDEQFLELVNFIKEVQFDHMGVFTYSKEEGTPAAKFKPQITKKVKNERYHQLMACQQEIVEKKQCEKIGQVVEVIVEGYDTGTPYFIGRSSGQAADIDGKTFFTSPVPLELGQIVLVEIVETDVYDLIGVKVNDETPEL